MTMTVSPPNSPSGNTVLLFGPQFTSFTPKSANELRSTLLNSPHHGWILDTVAELPRFWESAAKAVPKLQGVSGLELLQDFNDWIHSGRFQHASFPLPNILLTPIAVITELVQYTKYLRRETLDIERHPKTNTETLGFCTGLLSAMAVASSANHLEIVRYGAVAIRLAMLAGALVDQQNESEGSHSNWTSVSVGWSSLDTKAQMQEVLNRFTEAYTSVSFDENRVTVTSPKAMAGLMVDQLTAAGLTVKKFDLRGHFHCSCYRDDINLLLQFCDSQPGLQFPDAANVILPTRDNTEGKYIQQGKLHHVAIKGILSEPSNWYQTFTAVQSSLLSESRSRVICFGIDRSIPPTLASKLGKQIIHATDYESVASLHSSDNSFGHVSPYTYPKEISDNEIAVVGMACKVAGADDLEEFWKVLCQGESQHMEIHDDFRFNFNTVFRGSDDSKRKWFGNFIQDADAFDHKFWRKSPREAASTDPQQRLMMSVALQAVIQAGYFHSATLENHHIGCFLGIGNVDYEENINCHEPTAFMATGNLRSFTAGKISHALGWTGPALTIDTACSSSGVAIHQACKAILTGECTAALAGGAAIMTSPRVFQDLAAASFLSPTGPCKSFDATADGYCRGDGVGAVFLKKMSKAIADGDQILGVIASSAVYQNQNCTAITVPNSVSLSDLFSNVTRQALVSPTQVSFVEAHGTGTQVGDPAEYDGVRRVFGGAHREDNLSVGSVKSVVGHTEGAAGIVSLIKVLLMMNEGVITPQANFKTINPAINSNRSDKMEVAARLKSWDVPFRAALINSYGASGSNASMLVTQAPQPNGKLAHQTSTGVSYPFWFCGLDERSVQAYAKKFLSFLKSESFSAKGRSIANLSYNVARQTNRWLPRALVFSCASKNELVAKLSSYINGEPGATPITRPVIHPDTRPVILCFGGQVSTYVGLDRDLYQNVTLLRRNLDQCDAVCKSLDLDSIYPDIFQRVSIEDTVKLQVILFSMQYSTAKSWMDCGLQVSAVVGHSFGELTALCVSGVLTLDHAIQLVAGRSRVIRDSWGSEKGIMLAVEAREEDTEKLLAESSAGLPDEPAATIACFNGPTSFTLAGSSKAIEAVQETAAKNPAYSQIKIKRLNVTNAFHSTLVEPLMGDLGKVAEGLIFSEPTIHLERATETVSSEPLDPQFVAHHLRYPVFFHHAVQRLSKKHASAVWLEAGSNSTITTMAKRALGHPSGAHFQPMSLTSENSWELLTDTTMKLWQAGINVPFWPHHMLQTTEYLPLILPPYQFEKVSHWLGRKLPSKMQVDSIPAQQPHDELPRGLWTFSGYRDQDRKSVWFRVNKTSPEFEELVSGYKPVLGSLLAPNSMMISIVIEALLSLQPDHTRPSLQPEVQNFQSYYEITMDSSKTCWLEVEPTDLNSHAWVWKILSDAATGNSILLASGRLVFRSGNETQYQSDLARYERLIGHNRCVSLLDSSEVTAGLQGRNIYQTFNTVVSYGSLYKLLRKVVSRGTECAGRIVKAHTSKTWVDIPLADAFCQVSTIFVNCMNNAQEDGIWIPHRIEKWIRSAKLPAGSPFPEVWDIFASHHRISGNEYSGDIFVFDSHTGSLAEVILGIQFQRISRDGSRSVNVPIKAPQEAAPEAYPVPTKIDAGYPAAPAAPVPTNIATKPAATLPQVDVSGRIFSLLADLSGLELADINNDTELPDIGIDSLMGMELARDIEKVFSCSLDVAELNEVVDVQSLIKCIESALGIAEEADDNTAMETPSTSGESTKVNGTAGQIEETSVNDSSDGVMHMPRSIVLETFQESKALTDDYISKHKLAGYCESVIPKQTEMCVVHILDAFDKMGVSLRTALPGQKVDRIPYHPRHERFIDHIYNVILKESGVIETNGLQMTRTDTPISTKSAKFLLDELLREAPEHSYDHKLTYLGGYRLADVLTDACDGIQLLFTSTEGREAVSGMYAQSPINVAWIMQMEGLFRNLIMRLPLHEGPLKILEMGAGTGGTTAKIVAILAALNVPVEYTVTDISPSLVAAARKRFKQHPFVKYRAYDIEKPPTQDLLNSQHIVLATNCVHATHNLVSSTRNIRGVLRSDGFLIMLEMTQTIPWIDLVFGTLEGWWLFDDGRKHALVSPEVWQETLHSVGYGRVEWTDGILPESSIQRVIIAMAS